MTCPSFVTYLRAVGSAEKDPAVGLFKTYWGEKWAEDFTHNFLFSMSELPPKIAPAGPVVSGAGA